MNQAQHTAIYYNGQTREPNEVQIEVFGNSLRIFYGDSIVVWAISEIEYSSFSGRGKTMLQYGTFPHQYLEFQIDSALAQTLKGSLPEREGKLGVTTSAYSAIIKGTLIILAIVSFILAVLYFALLPLLASFIAAKVPVSTEIAIGDKLYQNFIKGTKIDLPATKILNEFAGNINFETNYPLQFTVVENEVVNAFALPGGHVVVFSEMLERIKSSEELAALLAHEVTHIKERHSLKGLTRNLAGSLLISLVFGDSGTVGNLLVNQADGIYQLGFSRNMEKEADLEGLQIMAHNGVNTQGMLRLMQHLQEEEKKHNVSKITSYLNSHPLTSERIAYIQKNSRNNNELPDKTLEEIWNRMQTGSSRP